MQELSPYRRPPSSPSTLSPAEGPRFPSESPSDDTRIFLQNFWQIIRKRFRLILLFLAGTLLTTVAVIFTMTPIYTAKTVVLIERQVPRALEKGDIVSPQLTGPDEYDYYKTQYEILNSESLATRVIAEQVLQTESHFSPIHKKSQDSWWAKATGWITKDSSTDVKSNEGNRDPSMRVDPRVVEAYQKSLAITPIPKTRLVAITFSTPDADLSARVANAHAEAFIRQGVELRSQAVEEARHFLETKLVELKTRVEDSEGALNRYRQQKGILSLDDRENVVVGRLVDLNKLLTEAEAERIGLEAQVHLVRKRDYAALPAVLSSTLIQTLRAQLTTIEGEYASLSAQFKPGFPRLDQLKAQVEEMRRRLGSEVQKTVSGVESAYLAAGAKEGELREKMEEQKAAALNLKNASVEYAILSREVDTNRQLYDSVLQRIKEIGISTDSRSSNVSVVDKASSPRKPSKPKIILSLLLASVLGLVGGLGIAVATEYLDNTIKSPEDVQHQFGLPNLAVVPDFVSLLAMSPGSGSLVALSEGVDRRRRRRTTKLEDGSDAPTKTRRRSQSRSLALITPGVAFSKTSSKELAQAPHPFSIVLESYRTLRTAILLSRPSEPPKSILFTSSIPGDGKSVTALNTAMVLAHMGARVLLIDADLRHATCHDLLGIHHGLGLTELLTGQKELYELVQSTSTPQLYFLSGGGSVPPDPAELLGSRRMQEVLSELQQRYDYVVVDSPPVMPVSDALLLSTMVDGVILVINSQTTPRYIVKETQARLHYARARILGVVLNKVNMQTSSYAYYYGSYVSYYPSVTDGGKAKSPDESVARNGTKHNAERNAVPPKEEVPDAIPNGVTPNGVVHNS